MVFSRVNVVSSSRDTLIKRLQRRMAAFRSASSFTHFVFMWRTKETPGRGSKSLFLQVKPFGKPALSVGVGLRANGIGQCFHRIWSLGIARLVQHSFRSILQRFPSFCDAPGFLSYRGCSGRNDFRLGCWLGIPYFHPLFARGVQP